MVVVGWSDDDSSWHIGLLLDPQYAPSRGGRWCELARWITVSGADPESAGHKLADILRRPFRLVPPEPIAPSAVTVPTDDSFDFASQTIEQPKNKAALHPLPLQVGEWTVSSLFNGMQWERTKRWRNASPARPSSAASLLVNRAPCKGETCTAT